MFTPIKNTKVYEQVIDQIKEMIKNGTLKKGDKLPSERDLVEQLGVSRASIREALRVLEIIGLLDCRQGEGNFIKHNFDNGLFEPLSVMFMLNESKPEEIFELRKVIEIETAALAAKRITEEELKELYKLIEEMKSSESEDDRTKIDKKFHYTIAYASRNFLILNILNTVSTLMDSFIKNAREEILKKHYDKDIINSQHKSICDALSLHNPSEAALAMRKHMDLINENLNFILK
ncbi:HTH-type transcriptional regulator LutR [Clostridium homopropionicum DSM 5847]|uniref:HTH-type transcriptional regulator LutR n=1 Tax=Clostridium homopropionicum DSM 5847 TaxID=1121318 RepID=A0A0L6ZEJ4_9CLOT|nr:FadR/GntR family transcriptional regulator [Clostridium homopropionicum]KOA21409.1 HTH-type transcriptional regulator LutR [Clostridium homopropionicum DSM 5847]SFG10823.1 transcriptional regulator, GntR family [Clostridium homopropionicum]